jgi:hypothetical protein
LNDSVFLNHTRLPHGKSALRLRQTEAGREKETDMDTKTNLRTGLVMSVCLLGIVGTAAGQIIYVGADADGDDRVNLIDYAYMGDNWLKEILWPEP